MKRESSTIVAEMTADFHRARTGASGPLVSTRLLHRLTASPGWKAHGDRGIRTPTSRVRPSTQPAAVQPFHQSQEYPLPRVPRQQAIDQPAAAPHDLTGHLDQRRA